MMKIEDVIAHLETHSDPVVRMAADLVRGKEDLLASAQEIEEAVAAVRLRNADVEAEIRRMVESNLNLMHFMAKNSIELGLAVGLAADPRGNPIMVVTLPAKEGTTTVGWEFSGEVFQSLLMQYGHFPSSESTAAYGAGTLQ